MPFTKVATLAELPPGELIEVLHDGEPYALCNVGGNVRALFGTCPHEGGPLGQGALEGPIISCPWHCWQFDSGTGTCVFGENLGLAVFPVKVEDGQIYVDFDDA